MSLPGRLANLDHKREHRNTHVAYSGQMLSGRQLTQLSRANACLAAIRAFLRRFPKMDDKTAKWLENKCLHTCRGSMIADT